jgi:hypothetical protein
MSSESSSAAEEIIQTPFDLEEYLMQYMKERGLLEKFWSSFMETPEGLIFSQINMQERDRLRFYHFLQTGQIMEDPQDPFATN